MVTTATARSNTACRSPTYARRSRTWLPAEVFNYHYLPGLGQPVLSVVIKNQQLGARYPGLSGAGDKDGLSRRKGQQRAAKKQNRLAHRLDPEAPGKRLCRGTRPALIRWVRTTDDRHRRPQRKTRRPGDPDSLANRRGLAMPAVRAQHDRGSVQERACHRVK